jgi:hypothetical protein
MRQFHSIIFLLLSVISVEVNAFVSRSPLVSRQIYSSLCMVNADTVVVGVAGGVAESVACQLLQSAGGGSISAVFDRKPFSPLLLEAAKSKKLQIFSANFDKDQLLDITDERIRSFPEILAGKIVVAVNDEGDDLLRGGKEKNTNGESALMLTRLLKALPPSIQSMICATSAESDKVNGGVKYSNLIYFLLVNIVF